MDEDVTVDAEEGVALWTDDTLRFVQFSRMDGLRLITACTAESRVNLQDLCNCLISVCHHQFLET